MKQTITEYQFTQAFVDADRADNFSYEGRKALFNYFEELEHSCETEMEFDVIGICCEYSEYNSAIEVAAEYGELELLDKKGRDYLDVTSEYKGEDLAEEVEERALAWLQDHTQVIEHSEGVIIAYF